MKSTADYQGDFQYENGTLQFIAQPEGYIYKDATGYRYVYQYKDHLGNNRLSFMRNAGTVAIVKETNYYPFGLTHQGYNNITTSLGSAGAKKYQYNGKELQDDFGLDWYDYGARFYDPAIGRWTTVDPAIELHYNYTPYAYVYNDPIRLMDPFGQDSVQRAKATQRAKSYVTKKKPGNQYKMGAKGGPGKKTDCSGLVSNCVEAGGEHNPNHGDKGSGVLNIESNTKKIKNTKDVTGGNLVSFRYTKKGSYPYHIGIIISVKGGKNGKIKKITYIQSSGGVGPNEKTITVGQTGHLKIHGYYKWDTRPDPVKKVPEVNISNDITDN